jgi:hypothetical protein
MFRVTVKGDTKEWYNFDWALMDALGRGMNSEWTLEKVNDE